MTGRTTASRSHGQCPQRRRFSDAGRGNTLRTRAAAICAISAGIIRRRGSIPRAAGTLHTSPSSRVPAVPDTSGNAGSCRNCRRYDGDHTSRTRRHCLRAPRSTERPHPTVKDCFLSRRQHLWMWAERLNHARRRTLPSPFQFPFGKTGFRQCRRLQYVRSVGDPMITRHVR